SFMLTYFYYPGDTLGISYEGFRVLNLANDDTGEFHTETMPVLSYNDLATDHLHIDALLFNNVTEHWMHKEESDGTLIPFEYELSATSDQGAIALSTVSKKPPLIPGDDGLFDHGAASYTYYYSLTENLVEGTLTFEGSSEPVTGTAWIDRQYGTFNPNTDEQYEWFYLQLSNGMDLNIWNLFTPENQLPDHPAYKHISVYVDSSTQYTSHDFKLERLSWAKMPVTENCYAQAWRLTSETNQMDLSFSTLHHNSEVEIPFNFFEGPITATGSVNGSPVTGVGFAELLKTYESPQIHITRPRWEWNRDFPIQWEVQNPDDGRPLLFDLTYSITGEGPWSTIATEINDTLFYWNNPPFVNEDSCWFRVEGYTAHKTLQGSVISTGAIIYNDQYTAIDPPDELIIEISSPTIYPNPAGDMLWIHPSGEGYQSYSVLDLTGRILLEGSVTGEGIDIKNLEGGVYLFLLKGLRLTSVQRFIKKR
ncbi:MAG: T9SS type A sorting domain-containing protein, partial [Bacteroidales bacterium]|nr:T9SS type A sorting domain-containing protein [Bacteroidales bacterium]